MNIDQLKEILNKITKVKIAVYGDFCLDAYWILNPEGGEISAETGIKTRAVSKHYYRLGGASNVVANLSALHPAKIRAIGVIGNDIFGKELNRLLSDLNVEIDSMVIQEEKFDTVTFAKRFINNEEISRMDFGFFNNRSKETNLKIIENLRAALQESDAVIFNQQVPDSLDDEFINDANEVFNEFSDKIILLDSRHYGFKFKQNIYRKANEVEAACLNGVDANVLDSIEDKNVKEYIGKLYKEAGKLLFITRGSKGILTIDKNGISEISGIKLDTKLDPVGAGDTTLSALALCLGAGLSPAKSAEFANLAAAVTVQKLYQCGTASGEEIIELYEKKK